MKTIEIKTDTRLSKIYIGEHLQNLGMYVPEGKKIIITDDNILKFYAPLLPHWSVINIGTGEKNKTLQTLEIIFDKLIEFEADRSTFIVAIGGGIVCDVAGFAASVYMRGLRFGFVSTTLLSQVDASVGGKNGVNFRGFKNMIGVFNQPEFVICDPAMLITLDKKEFRSGFAEIVKAAAIKDSELFGYIEKHADAALKNDKETIEQLVYEAVKIKAAVVQQDEKEKGERRKLNFGHTFAHSFENLTGILHGEAVSIGMVLASKLSERFGVLGKTETKRIEHLLKKLDLPTNIDLNMMDVFASMKKDKKREGDSMHMVLIDRIGNALIRKTSLNELEHLIYDLH